MSCSADRRTARDKFLSKRLYIFRHRAIIRKPWGRGSGGRAMRSQRIGQGFESPRLHQNPKDTAKSVSFGFLRSRQGSDTRDLRTLNVTENICSNTAGGVMINPRAGSAAAQPTLSPSPSPERNDRLANLYLPSDTCPYGEAPLVTTRRDTARSVSFGFLRSRQGSAPRVLGTLSVTENICSNTA